jgi:hypothetical protein
MRFRIIALIALSVSLASCYKTVDVKLPEQELFTALLLRKGGDTTIAELRSSILLTDYNTRFIPGSDSYERNFPRISGADFKVYSSNGKTFTMKETGPGNYVSVIPYEANVSYTAKITPPGKKTITGTFVYPSKPEFSVTYQEHDVEAELTKYRLTLKTGPGALYFSFRTSDVDFYNSSVIFYSNSPYLEDRETSPLDNIFNEEGDGLQSHYNYTYINASGFPEGEIVIDFYVPDYSLSDNTVSVELRNLPYAVYEYEKTWDISGYTEGDPFAQPIEVYSNMEGGKGVFALPNVKIVPLN